MTEDERSADELYNELYPHRAATIPPASKPRGASEVIARLRKIFEDKAQQLNGVEVWYARDLQPLLGYSEWRNFNNVIAKAKEACKLAGAVVEDHFVEVNKMIEKGKGAQDEIGDIALTRYASYLVAQNGDPQKRPIAFAQTYFALQTRKQEVLEERLAEIERLTARERLEQTEREFSGILYERGVDHQGFAIIRSRGDSALFGGHTTGAMKKRMGVPDARPLADFLPTVTIKAKDLAAEITNHTVRTGTLRGMNDIGGQHVNSNRNVRKALLDSGIRPENLAAEEDVKLIARRHKSEARTLPKGAKGVPRIEKG